MNRPVPRRDQSRQHGVLALGSARSWLEHWLQDGKFRWSWGGDDWWLNRDGEVTDT